MAKDMQTKSGCGLFPTYEENSRTGAFRWGGDAEGIIDNVKICPRRVAPQMSVYGPRPFQVDGRDYSITTWKSVKYGLFGYFHLKVSNASEEDKELMRKILAIDTNASWRMVNHSATNNFDLVVRFVGKTAHVVLQYIVDGENSSLSSIRDRFYVSNIRGLNVVSCFPRKWFNGDTIEHTYPSLTLGLCARVSRGRAGRIGEGFSLGRTIMPLMNVVDETDESEDLKDSFGGF
jgi:hypothetical protein